MVARILNSNQESSNILLDEQVSVDSTGQHISVWPYPVSPLKIIVAKETFQLQCLLTFSLPTIWFGKRICLLNHQKLEYDLKYLIRSKHSLTKDPVRPDREIVFFFK